MIEEPFLAGHSWLHRFPPHLRLSMGLAASLAVAFLGHRPLALGALFCALLLLATARPPLRPLGKRLITVNFFLFFLGIVVPVTMPGHILWYFGPLRVSQEGLDLVFLTALKGNAIVCIFLATIATQSSPMLGYAMSRLHIPAKLIFLFLFTYRYLHVLEEEWHRRLTAARLRGFQAKTNMHTYKTVGNLFAMTLIHSIERAERIQQAMLLRGFTGQFHMATTFETHFADAALCVFWILTATLLIAADKGWLTYV